MRAKQITKLVEDILKTHPRTRDSDKDLFIAVLQMLGADLSERQREIMRSVNLESVRRLRQKLQEDGQYLPSVDVAQRRKLKAQLVKDAVPYGNHDLTMELLNKPAPSWMDGIGSRL